MAVSAVTEDREADFGLSWSVGNTLHKSQFTSGKHRPYGPLVSDQTRLAGDTKEAVLTVRMFRELTVPSFPMTKKDRLFLVIGHWEIGIWHLDA